MRKKQCATRRIATSDEEPNDKASTESFQPTEANITQENSQPPLSISSIESNSLQDQLEDGTVIVQPEPAAADEADDYSSIQGGRASMSSAPGIYDTIKCTACGKKVNPYNGTMQVHPLLKVLVCQQCHKYYASGCFDIDEEGKENQCRWCGEGGMLICCDQCEHSYCRTCIKRNLGRSALQQIESLPDSTPWYCYSCEPSLLKDLQQEANVVMRAVRDHFKQSNRRSEKHKAKIGKHFQPAPVIQQPAPLQQPLSMMGLQLDLSSVPKSVPKLPMMPAEAQRLPPMNKSTIRIVNSSRPVSTTNRPVSAASTASASKGNSAQGTEQWYKTNVKIESILADIESVDTQSIGVALNATVNQLQSMMRQYSRFLQDLAAAKSQQDKLQIVSRFKSAYRMHLFLRLGKINSLIVEEQRHIMRKSIESSSRKQSNQCQQRYSQPRTQAEPVIDLTDDCSSLAEELASNNNNSNNSYNNNNNNNNKQVNSFQLNPSCGTRVIAAPTCVVQQITMQQQQQQLQAQKAPIPSSSEVVVVLSDEEDTNDSCGSAGSRQQKPAAIVELLEQRRQREKSRKLQQPRRITVTDSSRQADDDNSSATAAAHLNDEAVLSFTTEDHCASSACEDEKANSESDVVSGQAAVKRTKADADSNCADNNSVNANDDTLSESECPTSCKKPRTDNSEQQNLVESTAGSASDATAASSAQSSSQCIATQPVAAL